jgi:thiol:disulfide interchange protein
MKRLLFCVFIAVLFSCSQVQAQGIRFSNAKTWSEVLAQAKQENKLVFLDAYTTWCGPCKYMQKDIFPKPSVGKFYNANFINVKMDMEKGEGPELARQFSLTAIPTLLFFDGDGNEVHRFVGALEAPAFIKLGKEAIDPARRKSGGNAMR